VLEGMAIEVKRVGKRPLVVKIERVDDDVRTGCVDLMDWVHPDTPSGGDGSTGQLSLAAR
jgi:hypothetical protein